MAEGVLERGECVSGICGICEPGLPASRLSLAPLFAALSHSGDAEGRGIISSSASLGAVSRWPGQLVGEIPGVRLAVDADLLQIGRWTTLLEREGLPLEELSLAQRLALLYRLRGVSFLNELQGAFALALWDESSQMLVLAIDRMGIKALCWAQERERLTFATRPSAIRAVQQKPSDANQAALMQYLLFSVVPAPMTAFEGIVKLRPGHLVRFTNGTVREECYWDVAYEEDDSLDEVSWANEVREGLRSAVHRHLKGCAPESTGAYLSGGTDSSSVVAFMSERFAPTHSYSVHFSEQGYSEIGYARTTADRFQTAHHEKCLVPGDAASAMQQILAYYDEPFANSSAFGTYACAKMAHETGVDTLLAGDGGDEIFAGNERYASDKRFSIYHTLPVWVRRGVVEPLASLLPDGDSALALPKHYLRRANISNPRRIFSYGLYLSLKPEEVFETAFLRKVPFDQWMEIAEGHFQRPRGASELNRLMYLDLKLILADNDLRKVSGTAELSGVQVRYPMLDTELVQLAAKIPSRLKLRGFKKRYIFKKAMAGILPDQVLNKQKHGFGVPLSHWFLQEPKLESLLQDVLHDSQTRCRGYFRPEFLVRLSELHRRENTGYYGEALWYIVALELWHRLHLQPQGETVFER
jgi:asparagine synthase (glutamine-hydrolysing)